MKILKCPSCGNYTMKEICSVCNVPTVEAKPPNFPEDKYGKYRRMEKYGIKVRMDNESQKGQ